MKKIIFSLLVAMVATVWNTNAQVQTGGTSPDLTAIFSEDFESMNANATPTGWSISGSTAPKILFDRADYGWGVYQYQGKGNKMIRMYNAAGSMKGIALIKSPSIQLPTTGPCQLKFKYSHLADCGNFTVKISTNNGSTWTDLCALANNGTYNKFQPGTMTEKTIDLASYLGQTAIIQFYAYANESQGSIFVDDVTVLGQTPAISLTVGPSGYATIVTTDNLTVPSDVEVFGYTFDDFSVALIPGDAITAGEILPSGKGYVVKASPGEYTFTGTSAAAGTTAKFASVLTGWTTDKAASEAGGTVYGLGIVSEKVGFYKFSGATIPAGKAVYVKSEN